MFAVTCSGERPKMAVCFLSPPVLFFLFSSTLVHLVYTVIIHYTMLDSPMISACFLLESLLMLPLVFETQRAALCPDLQGGTGGALD